METEYAEHGKRTGLDGNMLDITPMDHMISFVLTAIGTFCAFLEFNYHQKEPSTKKNNKINHSHRSKIVLGANMSSRRSSGVAVQ